MFYLIKQYLKYTFRSKNVSTANSRFIKDFKENVLNRSISSKDLQKINELKEYYLKNNIKIQREDYGAGSKTVKQNSKINTSDLARNVSVKPKFGKILYQLVSYFKINHVLELGSSLGISSAYLSKTRVTSLEGNSELASFTSKTLTEFNFDNVQIINTQFDAVFEDLVKENHFDLIFIDGNHSQEATLRYFEIILKYKTDRTIVIFDDINWSSGMNNAWNIIKAHKDVNLSIDLFTFGIVFFSKSIKQKENTVLWY